MKYLKNYQMFREDVEQKPNVGSSDGVALKQGATMADLDAAAKKQGLDPNNLEDVAAMLADFGDQLENQLDNPKPKLVVSKNVQSLKERIQYLNKFGNKINEGGHGGEHSLFLDIVHYGDQILAAVEHIAHGMHGTESIDKKIFSDVKTSLIEKKSKIREFLEWSKKKIGGLTAGIMNATYGQIDKLIIWICRNIFKMKVSSSAKAGSWVLSVIFIGLFLLFFGGAVIAGTTFAATSLTTVGVLKSIPLLVTKLSGEAGIVVQIFNSLKAIFTNVKGAAKMGSGSETMTVLEFADVIEDLVKNPGKEFRSDLKEVFVSTTAVRRLKMIDSHFSKDQRKKLSEILKEILDKKDYKKLGEIPYFKQCLKEYEGEKVTARDLELGMVGDKRSSVAAFFGIGHSEFQHWVEELVGEKEHEIKEEIRKKFEAKCKELKEKGVKITFTKGEGEDMIVDHLKYMEYADKLDKDMAGMGMKVRIDIFKEKIQSEIDWILLFFNYGVRDGMNLIRNFVYEMDSTFSSWSGKAGETYKDEKGTEISAQASTDKIKKHLEKIGVKNVDSQFEFFGSKKNASKFEEFIDILSGEKK